MRDHCVPKCFKALRSIWNSIDTIDYYVSKCEDTINCPGKLFFDFLCKPSLRRLWWEYDLKSLHLSYCQQKPLPAKVAIWLQLTFIYTVTQKILTDFWTYFTSTIRRKFVTILHVSVMIPPHLKCVTTLPCAISTTETRWLVMTHFEKLTIGNNVFIVSLYLS